jgi:hypothetical protein
MTLFPASPWRPNRQLVHANNFVQTIGRRNRFFVILR